MKRALSLACMLVALACGRTPQEPQACVDAPCACIFDADCADGFVCIDNLCVNRADVRQCLERGAEPETCNGRDDDCDGLIDDGMDPRPCVRDSAGLSCPGIQICFGVAGYVCDAAVPSDEVCNGLDDDCDGVVDDPFVTNGTYVDPRHCAACGRDCLTLIQGATAADCDAGTCRATACVDGRVPSADGARCLLRQDGLCESCSEDGDCPLPGSQCIDLDGERFCGRACGDTSALGPCPSGFMCVATQCVPSTGTCLCSNTSEGLTRACQVDACAGVQVCSSSVWSACDISANRETCDGLDNDCDGAADEDFLDDQGRYATSAHCGTCNNDCSRLFGPEDHAIGACGFDRGRPTCVISACETERVGGVDFEFVDVNGDVRDGCECRRRAGSTADEPDVFAAFPDAGAEFEDANCDGIDGRVEDAVFVSANAAPAGDGSLERPLRTIAEGLQRLRAGGARYVLVAAGVYRERITMQSGDRIYGGYSADFSRRDIVQLPSVVRSSTREAVEVRSVGSERVVFSGLNVQAVDWAGAAPDGQVGRDSIGVWVSSRLGRVEVSNNVIVGGQAERGGRGRTGQDGFGREDSTSLNGQRGADQVQLTGPCPASLVAPGGEGGRNPSCTALGRDGGEARCPTFDDDVEPVRGGQSEFVNPVGGDGEGGFDWSFDAISGPSCSHITESGFPSDFQSNNGQDGADGADGDDGSTGPACGAPIEGLASLASAVFTAAAAQDGEPGALGGGGGGGGAGGGTAYFPSGGCPRFDRGATGGGGGAGGCGGEEGSAGGAGGTSVALLVSSGGGALDGIFGNRIVLGSGGRGGDGGIGGQGGSGGIGGGGGLPSTFAGSTGGQGGDGGTGGAGGAGGGGCGGSAIGGLVADERTFAPGEVTNADLDLGGRGGEGGRDGASGVTAGLVLAGPCDSTVECTTEHTCRAGRCLP